MRYGASFTDMEVRLPGIKEKIRGRDKYNLFF